MIPIYSVGLDGKPWTSWTNPHDPRHRISEFILAEVYLSLDNADDLLRALADPVSRKNGWEWHGNSHSLRMRGDRCAIIDHYPDLGDVPQSELELDSDQLAEAIAAWKEFVLRAGNGHP